MRKDNIAIPVKKILFVTFTLGLALTGKICSAGHEEGEQEKWNPVSAGPITTWTAPLCGKKKFVVQPFFFYNRTRGLFDSDGHYNSLPAGDRKYQFQQQLFVQYWLIEKLEIDGQIVYQENFAKQEKFKAHSYGFGDSYLFLHYCTLEETDYLPHLTLLFQVKLPTGKYEHTDPDKLGTDLMGATSGGGSYDTGYGLNLSKKLKPFILHGDIIYSIPNEVNIDGVKTRYNDYLNYDFGIEYFLPKGFNLMLEFNGFRQGDKRQDSKPTSDSDIGYFSMASGMGWSNDKLQTLLAYQRILTGTNTDANDSLILTFVYSF